MASSDAGVTKGTVSDFLRMALMLYAVLAASCGISCKLLQVLVPFGLSSIRSSSFCLAVTMSRHSDCMAPSKCKQPRHPLFKEPVMCCCRVRQGP